MLTKINRYLSFAIALPRYVKRILAIAVDINLCVLTAWLAFYLAQGEFAALPSAVILAIETSIVFALPVFWLSGFYRAIFRYWALKVLLRGMVVYGLFYAITVTAIGIPSVPRTIGIIQPLLLYFAITGSRLLVYLALSRLNQDDLSGKASPPRALIYGAGNTGRQMLSALNKSNVRVVGFLDDDDRLHGCLLDGVPIFSPDEMGNVVKSKRVTHVLSAIPSVSPKRRSEISSRVSSLPVAFRTLPSLMDLTEGRVQLSGFRELNVSDLLGRESVTPDNVLLSTNITNEVVMVTGAGGTIGSELCRQIILLKPSKLLLLENSEFALYSIHEELCDTLHNFENGISMNQLVPLLGSVNDEKRMLKIMDIWQPNTVFHAAAYKHVPLVEHNVIEGLRNNVFGTLTVAEAAIQKGVSNFVLISTDKAVHPTSVMGASKRLAEICLQSLYERENCKHAERVKSRGESNDSAGRKCTLSMVRFGNVLDSSGSVIPKFRKQISDGGPVTLTHAEITRYFMTIPEAAQLVIQACAMAKGGDVFLLDMGEPVKIATLAKRMIELSGWSVKDDNNPDGDIEMVVTGLRPGEKLYEELLLGDDPRPTKHVKINRARDPFTPWEELKPNLNTLKILARQGNVRMILALLQKLVTTYQPKQNIVDWVVSGQEQIRNVHTESEFFSRHSQDI